MPLRDHFRPPLDNVRSWQEFHGGWPMKIVEWLSRKLPPEYAAAPTIKIGSEMEIDIATFEHDEYEVRVYDERRGRRLVAAIEIVSPANKDRPSHRRAFVEKCTALLRKEVSVTIVDFVTTKPHNLYRELIAQVGGPPVPSTVEPIYSVACRAIPNLSRFRLSTWEETLTIGQPLPSLPLWLGESESIPLELEESYEETCRILRIR